MDLQRLKPIKSLVQALSIALQRQRMFADMAGDHFLKLSGRS